MQLLDHRGNPVDKAAIEMARQTKDDQYPSTHRGVAYSGRTRAGVLMTPDQALTISAVWACVRYLTQSIAKLPWNLLKRTGDNVQIQDMNRIHWMINYRPSEEWSSFQLRETLMLWALRWGNGYAEIERTENGLPWKLWPIHPSRVTVARDIDTEELFYSITPQRGQSVDVEARDIFHLRGMGEGPVGLSVMAYAAESLGWTKAAQLFGAAFFRQSANPSGIVQMKKTLSPEALSALRSEFNKLYSGPGNANRTVFLDNEMEYQAITVEQEKAQFIETNQYLLDEVCRWFGVPPHKIYNLLRSTFTNIEHQSLEVVGDSLKPWARRLADEADYKLLGQNRMNMYTAFDFREILQPDMKTRMEFYQGMRNMAAMNANEIRAEEGLNEISDEDGGNKYTMQSGNTTLEQIGQVLSPGAAPGTSPAQPSEEPDEPDEPEEPAETNPSTNDYWHGAGALDEVLAAIKRKLNDGNAEGPGDEPRERKQAAQETREEAGRRELVSA